MAGLFKKILPVVPSSPKPSGGGGDDDKSNIEYSFAIEYSGPPVSYDIPEASPIVIERIPIAVRVASPSLLSDRLLPVIQPIVRSTPVDRRRSKELELGNELSLCSSSLQKSHESLNGSNVSRESQSFVDSSNDVGFSAGDESLPESVHNVRGTGKFRTLDDEDNLCDGVGCSGKLNSADTVLQNGIHHSNRESANSASSLHAGSSKIFPLKEEYYNNKKTPRGVRGLSADPDTSNIVHGESDYAESIHVRPRAERHGKEVSCSQCSKESQSTEMEACVVCDATYCCNCVLRVLGSKPEGRKCVSCISLSTDECMPMSSDGIGSSDKVNNPNRLENMHTSVESHDDSNEVADAGFEDYMNPANSDSAESGVSSPGVLSEVFSCKEEEEEAHSHAKKPSIVTFRDPEPIDVVQGESDYSEYESIHEKPKAVRQGKKGSCYRCLKGNRFTEKEVCIVCGAKFCSNCVLRAMGSMPEGRKCVTCIGFGVDDFSRGLLGKCSRMLKRLLTEIEIKQIMRSEMSCEANQLPPERVFVNGEPLSQKELVMLQSCRNPPKKLNPEYYWYDKVSGFWGKIGHRPCQIISPQLNVGGQITRNASNGNTNVLINNREITKRELLMLQSAGVQCEGQPHFWVSADGSYQEEGMKNVKGCIWDKSRIKLVCALLSLPTPPDFENTCANDMDHCDQKVLYKLLLLGEQKSGTSTIYKQAKFMFKVPFSEEERENIKFMIQSNLYCYFGMLLEGRERFEEESLSGKGKRQVIDEPGPSGQIDDKTMYCISPRLQAFSDWLLKVMASGNLEVIFPAASREYAPFIEELWRDPGFQATYNRRNELDMLPRHATYFLERAVEISKTNYEPTDMDILYAEGIKPTNGLSCLDYSFPEPSQEISIMENSNQNDLLLRYQLVRVHPRSLGERCKWLEMFEDVDMILFCVSLTDYDEYFEDNNGVLTNKMLASRQLFENVATHPTFNQKNFLLILNKYDMLEEKIEQVPLSRCEWFRDFNPVISHHHHSTSRKNNSTPLAQYAAHYIAVKFKRLFDSLAGRKLFVSIVTALEQETVNDALKYAKEILKWDEEEPVYTNLESTEYEPSSSL